MNYPYLNVNLYYALLSLKPSLNDIFSSLFRYHKGIRIRKTIRIEKRLIKFLFKSLLRIIAFLGSLIGASFKTPVKSVPLYLTPDILASPLIKALC